jgi:small-conductance mechanosensitive channel
VLWAKRVTALTANDLLRLMSASRTASDMDPGTRLDAALKRLAAALDQLEAAAARRADAAAVGADLEEELAIMQDDRSRLAVELDGAIARANSLQIANAEVARRLERAGATVRSILAAADAAEPD